MFNVLLHLCLTSCKLKLVRGEHLLNWEILQEDPGLQKQSLSISLIITWQITITRLETFLLFSKLQNNIFPCWYCVKNLNANGYTSANLWFGPKVRIGGESLGSNNRILIIFFFPFVLALCDSVVPCVNIRRELQPPLEQIQSRRKNLVGW